MLCARRREEAYGNGTIRVVVVGEWRGETESRTGQAQWRVKGNNRRAAKPGIGIHEGTW